MQEQGQDDKLNNNLKKKIFHPAVETTCSDLIAHLLTCSPVHTELFHSFYRTLGAPG
jgi:hypothetical protein